MKVNLTRTERQILSNQNKILALLDADNADYYNANVEILTRGFELDYQDVFDVYPDDQVKSIEVCIETIDILSMFRNINNSIQNLEADQLAEINRENFRFSGFDASDVLGHFAYGQFMVEKLGKWDELAGRMPNSHSGMSLIIYRKMLEKLKELGNDKNDGISFEDLKELNRLF